MDYFLSPLFLVKLVGGILGLTLLTTLFRVALFGSQATRVQRAITAVIAGIIAIGMYSFNEGGGSIDPNSLYSYGFGSILIAIYLLFAKKLPTAEIFASKEDENKKRRKQRTGRGIAIALTALIALLGTSGWYQAAKSEFIFDRPSLSRLESNALRGEMAAFWQTVKERDPRKFEELMAKAQDQATPDVLSESQRLDIMNKVLIDFQREFLPYLQYIPVRESKALVAASNSVAKALLNDLELCAEYQMNGGAGFSRNELLMVRSEIVEAGIAAANALFEARDTSQRSGAKPNNPASEEDWVRLGEYLQMLGISQYQISLVVNGSVSDPDYCEASIVFMDGVVTNTSEGAEHIQTEIAALMIGETAAQ
jgi:hypothetical protein